jgi:antitoxin component YwqK of YwqJK toxin-antitoxin module
MKKILSFLLLSLYKIGSAQVVLDGACIREFYPITSVVATYFQIGNWTTLESTNKDDVKLFNKSKGLYPYCPVFSEDKCWAYRVWRDIPVSHEINPHLVGDGIQPFYGDDIVKVITSAILENACATVYRDENFRYPNTIDEVRTVIQGEQVTSIRIKEDWIYNKSTGEMTSYPIGLCLMTEEEGVQKELCWCYQPELLFCQGFKTVLNSQNITWDQLFSNHLCQSIVIRREMNDGTGDYQDDLNDPILLKSTELEALFEVEEMLLNLKWYNMRSTKETYNPLLNAQAEIVCLDGSVITGMIGNNMLQGNWKRISSKGDVILTCEFKNSIPVGQYQKYYPNGLVKERGEFDVGIRSGKWMSFYDNGAVHSERQYRMGGLDGLQQYFYSIKQKHCQFTFQNEMPNGEFYRWYPDGKLLDSGHLTNGYQDGIWQVNLVLNEQWKRILSQVSEPLIKDAGADGVLTLKTKITLQTGEEYSDHYRHTKITQTAMASNELPFLE